MLKVLGTVPFIKWATRLFFQSGTQKVDRVLRDLFIAVFILWFGMKEAQMGT